MNADNAKFIAHVVTELLVISGLSFYGYKRMGYLQSQIDELKTQNQQLKDIINAYMENNPPRRTKPRGDRLPKPDRPLPPVPTVAKEKEEPRVQEIVEEEEEGFDDRDLDKELDEEDTSNID